MGIPYYYYKLINPDKNEDLPTKIYNVSIEVCNIPEDSYFLGQVKYIEGSIQTLFVIRKPTKKLAFRECAKWFDKHYTFTLEES